MKEKDYTHIRLHKDTRSKIEVMKVEVAKAQGKTLSDNELLKRTFNIPRLKSVLISDAEIKKKFGFNKKGISTPIISVFIMLGVLLLIMVGFYAWAIFSPVFADLFDQVTTLSLQAGNDISLEQNPALVNESIQRAFVPVNTGVQNLQWFSYTILVVAFLGFIFLCFYIRTYPFLIIFWFGGMIVLGFVAIILSHAYQGLTSSGHLAGVYTAWTTQHFILTNFPHIIFTMGFIGGIILFVLVTRDSESESTT